jgi:hypothetical protein
MLRSSAEVMMRCLPSLLLANIYFVGVRQQHSTKLMDN